LADRASRPTPNAAWPFARPHEQDDHHDCLEFQPGNPDHSAGLHR
jgi:hypothetical protein